MFNLKSRIQLTILNRWCHDIIIILINTKYCIWIQKIFKFIKELLVISNPSNTSRRFWCFWSKTWYTCRKRNKYLLSQKKIFWIWPTTQQPFVVGVISHLGLSTENHQKTLCTLVKCLYSTIQKVIIFSCDR